MNGMRVWEACVTFLVQRQQLPLHPLQSLKSVNFRKPEESTGKKVAELTHVNSMCCL